MSIIQRVYQAHGMNYANLCIVLGVFSCAPPLQYLLVRKLGYLGAAWASSAYNNLYFFVQIPHLACCCGMGYLFVPRAAALHPSGMKAYLRLALPGLLNCLLQWWVVEVFCFLAGRLKAPDVTIASFTLAAQVQAMGTMAWIGLAVAASTLVGRRIGAGDVAGARRAACLTPIIGALLAACLATPVALLAPQIARAWTHDASIDALTARLLPLVAGVIACDALSNTLQGVCSGLGLPRLAAYANLFGYYGVGLPAALGLAYGVYADSADGVFGLWGGVGLAMLSATGLICLALLSRDWQLAAVEAQVRLALDAASAEDEQQVEQSSQQSGTSGVVNAVLTPVAVPAAASSSAATGTARRPLLEGGER